MRLKFLIVNTYYPAFLRSFYRRWPELKSCSYQEQLQAIMAECFGTADFYSANLKRLDCGAEDVIWNAETLQQTWAKENGIKIQGNDWLFQVLKAQIKEFQPDVLYIFGGDQFSDDFLQDIKPLVHLMVGQIACPLSENNKLSNYDLMLTSFPHYVDLFRKMGIASEYFKLGFESSILDKLEDSDLKTKLPVVFIGGFSNAHSIGTTMLEEISAKIPVEFWGYGVESLAKDSPVRKHYHGEIWGLEMFQVLRNAKIALNRHIDVANRFANNMRLYEATGVGTLLITDYKDNLHEMFIPGKEVVAYHDANEAVEQISYYLAHEEERKEIAAAGQKRTLKEHTYFHRMTEMVEIVKKYI